MSPSTGATESHGQQLEFLQRFGTALLAASRGAIATEGRSAVCVAFADMKQALDGADLQVMMLPRDRVLEATRKAAPELADIVDRMMGAFDPDTEVVAMLFDANGELMPWHMKRAD
ncbi:MAG: hypothetical protein AB7K09_14385 [Planctomycetota bacterium]